MTDVSPTPTPEPKASQQLASAWKSLSKNARIAIVVVSVFLVIVLSSAGNSSNTTTTTPDTSHTTTTVSVSEQYSSWKSSFSPVFAKMLTDYQQTTTDLNNGDMASSRVDFVTLSQDAIDVSSYANSPDGTLNAVIAQFAVDLGVLAGEGTQSLNNIDAGGDPTQGFYDACDAINSDITAMNDALDAANATY
jgi:hypothetical protein